MNEIAQGMASMRHGMVTLVRGICVLALLALAAGFAGALHPVGDSLAVFAGVFAVIAALMLAVSGWSRRVQLVIALAILAAMAPRVTAWVMPGHQPADALVIYQKNMLTGHRDRSALVADIRASGADAVMLQEFSETNRVMLDDLAEDMPTQLVCPSRERDSVAVLSSWPQGPAAPVCFDAGRAAAVQVVTPQGPVWLVSIHLRWPWPVTQSEHVAGLVPQLEALEGPVIVGGDLNIIPWSHSLRRIARTTDTHRLFPVRPTYVLSDIGMGITIDHVLAPRGASGTVSRRPKFSSDHWGLVARIGLNPG